MMKTRWLIVVVAVAHCIAVGGLVLMQGGCGMTRTPLTTVDEPPTPVMPPPVDRVETVPVLPTPMRPVETPAVRTWPEPTTTYVVAQGDNLSEIASRFNMSVSEIVALNNLSDPDKIRVGQTLILTGEAQTPGTSRAPQTETRPPKPSARVPENAATHVVKAGDTLSEIAAKYGIKTAELKQANQLTSDKILVGWKLVIPGAAGSRTRPSAGSAEPPSTGGDAAPIDDTVSEEPSLLMPPANAGGTGGEAAGEFRTHVVDEGEDLYSVAMMWGVSVQRIKELNNLDDSELQAGDRLKIPVSE